MDVIVISVIICIIPIIILLVGDVKYQIQHPREYTTMRCPSCGAEVIVYETSWECPECTDCGLINRR